MIIDCHTHCYPEEIQSAPRAWAEARHEHHWADLVSPIGRPSIQDWATFEQMLSAMDAAGVHRAVLLGWYFENESTCRWHNELIANWVRRAPDRFIGFASILPNNNVILQLESAQDLGLCGVGELHPGVQGFDSKCPHWRCLAEWCTSQEWPVNFHATAELGDHPSAVPTPLHDYLQMARNAPDLNIVLAHWGGGLPWLAKYKLPENLFFDCSASPLLYSIETFRKAIDQIGPANILFGSDYPLRLYPKKQKKADMETYLQQIETEADLDVGELNAILGGNAQRLLPKLAYPFSQ